MFFYNRHKTTLNSSDSGFATSRIECKRWVFSVRSSVRLSMRFRMIVGYFGGEDRSRVAPKRQFTNLAFLSANACLYVCGPASSCAYLLLLGSSQLLFNLPCLYCGRFLTIFKFWFQSKLLLPLSALSLRTLTQEPLP